MSKFVTSLVLLSFMASSAVYAEMQHSVEIKTASCLNKAVSTVEMKECTAQAEELWDAELDRVYQLLQKKLSAEASKRLEQAQQDWLKYQTGEFIAIDAIYQNVEDVMEGGTMWGLMAMDARVEVIKQRALILTDYLRALDTSE